MLMASSARRKPWLKLIVVLALLALLAVVLAGSPANPATTWLRAYWWIALVAGVLLYLVLRSVTFLRERRRLRAGKPRPMAAPGRRRVR
jgi:peptidoglycan/LPS O-acetylase OafA/YrhL